MSISDEFVTDPSFVLAIVPIKDAYDKPSFQYMDTIDLSFKKDIKILKELNGDKIHIYKDDERLVTISNELYEHSVKVIKTWLNVKKTDIKFLVADEKDNPVVVYQDNIGILIAPRVEDGN